MPFADEAQGTLTFHGPSLFSDRRSEQDPRGPAGQVGQGSAQVSSRTIGGESATSEDGQAVVEARTAVHTAVDGVFGDYDEVATCDLYFDLPFDSVDQEAFKAEVIVGLRRLGLPAEEALLLNVALHPGSVLAKIHGPVHAVAALQRLPLGHLVVFGCPARTSREELMAIRMDQSPMQDRGFGGEGRANSETPPSSGFRMMRIQRPTEQQTEEMTARVFSSRSQSVASSAVHGGGWFMDMESSVSGRRPSEDELDEMALRVAASRQQPECVGEVRSLLGGLSESIYGSRQNSARSGATSGLPVAPPAVPLAPAASGSHAVPAGRPRSAQLKRMVAAVRARCGDAPPEMIEEMLQTMTDKLFGNEGQAAPVLATAYGAPAGVREPSPRSLESIAQRVLERCVGEVEEDVVRELVSELAQQVFGNAKAATLPTQSRQKTPPMNPLPLAQLHSRQADSPARSDDEPAKALLQDVQGLIGGLGATLFADSPVPSGRFGRY